MAISLQLKPSGQLSPTPQGAVQNCSPEPTAVKQAPPAGHWSASSQGEHSVRLTAM